MLRLPRGGGLGIAGRGDPLLRAGHPWCSGGRTMKGDARIIDMLNEVLLGELTAISQYFLHSKMCLNWGYEGLGKKIYEESIDEMKHADRLCERILFLEGLPNLQKLSKLTIGTTVVEILKSDLALELQTVPRLNAGITLARQIGDNGSEELLMRILVDSENHVDWLESQVELVKQVGEAHYLAQQIHKE
jgi:bacterioferritin